ncbi:hypothetical protein, partial [Escherichia coli]
AAVDNRLGLDGPSFSAVREQLEHLQRTVQRFARDAGVLLDGETEAAPDGAGDTGFADAPISFDAPPATPVRGPAGAPGSR